MEKSPNTIPPAGAYIPRPQASLRPLQKISTPITGVFIFISGGMALAQSVGWSDYSVTGSWERHFFFSWFIATAVGALLSLPLQHILPKKFIMAISSVLILAEGIIFASASENADALIAGRYLNGIAVGLATVPFLVHASELSLCNSRGWCTGLEQFSMSMGIAIQMITTSQWKSVTLSVNCLHGILDIIMAILAAGALFLFVESPVDYIRLGDDAGALDCLARLQRPPAVTVATNAQLDTLKDYVLEQDNFSAKESVKRSIYPLVKMIIFRSMMLAFTYSIILTTLLSFTSLINGITWSPILAGCIRIFGSCLTLLIVDKLGRKLPSLLWAIIMGGLMVPMAIIILDDWNLLSSHKMTTVTSIWISMQFFVGLYAPVTSTYMSEAFPLRTKSYCMTICVIVEQIIQISIVAVMPLNSIGNDGSLMAMGIMILVTFACFCITMPETKKTSLKEAQGSLILMSGGMAMAQGLGWTTYRVTGVGEHFHYSWFIAMLIGTMLSIPVEKVIPKKFIMGISSLLLMAGGIIFIITPTTMDAIVAARYLNGIAVGLVTVPFLTHISEISRVAARGACVGLEQLTLTFGMALQMIITSQWDITSSFPANRLHGIFDVILATFAFLSLLYFIESPVDYLRMGDEASALGSLALLQRPPRVNSVTNVLLLEHNTYVREHEHLRWVSCLGPLLKMLFFRSMMLAFTFSLPLSLTLLHSMTVTKTIWPPILAAGLRFCGSLMSLLVTDKIGRKLPALVSSITIGALVVSIAVICNTSPNLQSHYKMSCITLLCLLLQFFAGLYAPLTSAYMSEAFPLKNKFYCMALCVAVEQIIQIIVICNAAAYGNDGTLMAEGIMILIAWLCLWLTMPETKNTPLREAQKRFGHFFDCRIF